MCSWCSRGNGLNGRTRNFLHVFPCALHGKGIWNNTGLTPKISTSRITMSMVNLCAGLHTMGSSKQFSSSSPWRLSSISSSSVEKTCFDFSYLHCWYIEPWFWCKVYVGTDNTSRSWKVPCLDLHLCNNATDWQTISLQTHAFANHSG